MRLSRTAALFAAVAMITLAPPPSAAGQRGRANAPKVSAPKAPKTRASAPKLSGPKAKPTQTVRTKSTGATTKSRKASATGQARMTGLNANGTSTTGTTTPTTTTTNGNGWTPDNPVAQKLSTKAKLLEKVRTSLRLSQDSDLNAATAGFKNFGQFVAAVNVSNNLGIEFADLKASMTGLTMDGLPTGEPTKSLGQSIQQLKPGADATTEATLAQRQADIEVGGSN
jgi:hypothetical protein